MIAVRVRRPCFADGGAHPGNNRAAGGSNSAITAIPARLIIKLVTHNRLTDKNNSFRISCTLNPNAGKDQVVKIVKATQSSLNFP